MDRPYTQKRQKYNHNKESDMESAEQKIQRESKGDMEA